MTEPLPIERALIRNAKARILAYEAAIDACDPRDHRRIVELTNEANKARTKLNDMFERLKS